MKTHWAIVGFLFLLFLPLSSPLWAESQGDYKGISDPFGDPANYEFAEDEKEDKEFFHLGRYFHLGLDTGVGFYTGGLGITNSPAFYVGARLVYFFDKVLAFEVAIHYARHDNYMQPDSNSQLTLDTYLMPITLGMRYYFDTKNAPKAIAIANPYLVGGGGIYIRSETITSSQNFPSFQAANTSTSSYGFYAGTGAEFNIYRRHLYLGIDLRYHLILFPDEDSTFGGKLLDGDRAGDYVSASVTFTYNF